MRFTISLLLLLNLLVMLIINGCMYARDLTNTDRSSTEQLLLTEAMHDAVERLEIPDVKDQNLALEIVSLAGKENQYLRAQMETRLRQAGAKIVKAEDADAVFILSAGVIGTTSRNMTFGVPSIPLGSELATPGIPIVRILKQHGYTKLRLVSFDRVSNAHLFQSKPIVSRRDFDVYGFLFMVVRKNDIYPGTRIQITID